MVLFSGVKVPFLIHYGGALIKCALYRKQLDLCHQCGGLGHRMDVCPSLQDRICRGCGKANPSPDHQCNPSCQLCGGEHLTANRKCKARFKMPYIVKRRRWERQRQREEEILASEATKEEVGRPSREAKPRSRSNQTVQITEPHTRSSPIQEPNARTTTATSVPIAVPQQRKRAGGGRCELQGGLGRRGQRPFRVASDLGRLQLLRK
ncbi:hypothetical protein MTO96_025542 [Rhipicephalus appendiculatus]